MAEAMTEYDEWDMILPSKLSIRQNDSTARKRGRWGEREGERWSGREGGGE